MCKIISTLHGVEMDLPKNTEKGARELAVVAQEFLSRAADSYRGFNVFSMAVGTDKQGALTYLHAANTKPIRHSLKDCAELKILRQARQREIYLKGMLVIGPKQPDQESGIETLTLHSCGKCRHAMWWYCREGSGVITPEMPILSALPDFSLVELNTPEDLWAIHGGPVM